MNILIDKLLMSLLIWVLQLVDSIFGIFKQLAGIENVSKVDTGEEVDIVSAFIDNDAVTQVFWGIVIIAAVVCAIAMIVAIVKAMFNLNGGERKSLVRITGQGLGTVFITLAMAGIMVTGIVFANSLLKDVHKSFNVDDTKISSAIFDISVEGTKIITYDYDDPMTLVKEDYNNPVWVDDGSGNQIRKIFDYKVEPAENAWKNGKMPNDFDINNITADDVFGNRPRAFPWIFEDGNANPNNNDFMVHLGGFNFLLGYFAGVIILVAVAMACLGLVKRLYDIVILFLALPLMVSTIPLDDGARFKVWRETVISKVVLAYGAVFAVNIFLLMVPVIQNLQIGSVMQMLLIVGGGLSISGGILLFARLFGTDAAESRDLAQSARTLMAGSIAGVAGIKSVVGKTHGALVGTRRGLTKAADLIDVKKGRAGMVSGGSPLRNIGLGSSANKDSSLGKALSQPSAVMVDRAPNGRFISPKLRDVAKFNNPIKKEK